MRRATPLYPETSLRRGLLLACLAVLAMLSPASAQPFLALDVTGGSSANSASPPETKGWRFSLAQPQQVVALGFWDLNANGLDGSHDVSLWNDVGGLLATATVTTSSTLEPSTHPSGDWRFEDLASPVDLPAGSYTIGAVTNATDNFLFSAIQTSAPAVTYLGGASLSGIGFPAPDDTALAKHFGPNLKLVPGPPPPPPLTNDDSPFRASPSIWVYHSRDGDGGYDFTTALPIGTHNLGIWATGGADSSGEEGPLCITSAEPPTGDEVCALDMEFRLSGDGELLSFAPAEAFFDVTESFMDPEDTPPGIRLRVILSSADAPLPAGYPPQEIGELSLEVGGGVMSVAVAQHDPLLVGSEAIGADGSEHPVAGEILFIPEPSEFLLLASGIAMLALLGRYRRLRTP